VLDCGHAAGRSLNLDINAKTVSPTLSWDDRGFNRITVTGGPAVGAAWSATETSPILTAGQMRDDVKALWQDLKDIWRWLTDPCP
jgi:hypothetical protein